MSIKLRKKPAALVPTPDGAYVQLFVDDDGLPKIKDSNGDVTQLSESAVLTLVEQGVSPTSTPNQLKVYSKDVAGNTELFALDSDGNEIQITDNGVVAGGGAASALATLGSPVVVSGAAPPAYGQGLIAITPTTAIWSIVPAGFLWADGTNASINVSSGLAPTTGQLLTAVSASSATWQDPAAPGPATDLATNASPVNVSGSSAPAVDQVLTATSSTTAVWADPPGGQTILLASPVILNTGALATVTEFTFPGQLSLEYYAFEFHLTVDQSVAPGFLGITIQADSFSFVLNATLVRSNTAVTYSSTTSSGSNIIDDSARSVGTYECVLTGGFRAANSPAPLVLRASSSAGQTALLTGSWGRVWKATGV